MLSESVMKRLCPSCLTEIIYQTKSQYNDAVKKNRTCVLCSNRKKGRTRKYIGSLTKICINCGTFHTFSNNGKYKQSADQIIYLCKKCATKKRHTGKLVSQKTKTLIANKHRGMVWSDEARKKLSETMSGKNNPMYGKVRDDVRLRWLKTLEENGVKPRPFYNPVACKAIDEYGKQHGYNFQHAENGGEFYIKELGYWVDGYDKEKNVVIEYDEPYHTRPRQIVKDLHRQQAIEQTLHCRFIRLFE